MWKNVWYKDLERLANATIVVIIISHQVVALGRMIFLVFSFPWSGPLNRNRTCYYHAHCHCASTSWWPQNSQLYSFTMMSILYNCPILPYFTYVFSLVNLFIHILNETILTGLIACLWSRVESESYMFIRVLLCSQRPTEIYPPFIKISFTLYPAHSRVGKGNLMLRHSVLHFQPNFWKHFVLSGRTQHGML